MNIKPQDIMADITRTVTWFIKIEPDCISSAVPFFMALDTSVVMIHVHRFDPPGAPYSPDIRSFFEVPVFKRKRRARWSEILRPTSMLRAYA